MKSIATFGESGGGARAMFIRPTYHVLIPRPLSKSSKCVMNMSKFIGMCQGLYLSIYLSICLSIYGSTALVDLASFSVS
jgi:hypothetical protein